MGVSDYGCVIVGDHQQQRIYNTFEKGIHSDHKNLPLKDLKQFYDEEENIFEFFEEPEECNGTYDYYVEPNNAIVIIRAYSSGGEKPNCNSIFNFDERRFNWIGYCNSSAGDWDFYLPDSTLPIRKRYSDENLAINYTYSTPFRLWRENLHVITEDSEERAVALEKLLKISIPKKEDYKFSLYKKTPDYLYCVSIHPQAFRHIVYGDNGCDPMMLIDICENKNIPSNFREKWLNMNYGEALKDIRWYFSYIRTYFEKSNQLESIYQEFKKSNEDLFNGYISL